MSSYLGLMGKRIRIVLAVPLCGLFLAAASLAAEPNEDMRMFARLFAALEARDIEAYCTTMMHGAAYPGYMNRVCQSAVQNKMKKSEDCSPENVAEQIKADTTRCQAMAAAEFEAIAQRSSEAREKFIKDAKAKGVDGEKLLREERADFR